MRLWARLAAGAALLALVCANSGARRLVRNAFELRRSGRKLAELRGEEASLKGRLKALQTDDAALETAARRDLGLLKPGETEYRFTERKQK